MDLETGARIGAYRIARRLGRGTSGVVYQAVHPEFGDVAIKLLHSDVADDEGARVRFVREADTLVRLRHRNIVTIFESGVTEDVPFLAMELLAGTTLAAKLASGEPMSLERKLDIAIQLCDGLQFVHERGVIHRDVKPANVWLMSNAGVKLLDFGTARILGSTFTRAGDVIGSAAYMAPEQFGGKDVDARADIFAAGAIVYELLTGRRPFEAEGIAGVMNKILREPPVPLSALVPGLSPDIVTAVETALQKDAALRYPRAADFSSDLRLARYAVESDTERTIVSEPSDAPVLADPASSAATVIVLRHPPAEAATLLPPGAATRSEERTRSEPAPVVPSAPPVGKSRPAAAPQPLPAASSREIPRARPVARPVASFGAPVVAWVRRKPWPVAAGIALAAALVLVALIVQWQPSANPVFRLDVRSVPAGASIEIDGVVTAYRTPAAVTLLARPKRLRLAAAGFEAVDADLAAASTTEPLVLSITLRRLLRVDSQPAGARILVGGRDTGLLTPAEVPIDAGPMPSLQLELGRDRVEVKITDATLTSGVVSVPLTPARAPSVQLAGGTAPAPTPAPPPPPVQGGSRPEAPVAPSNPKTSLVSVLVTGSYPFEITGCGRSSTAAAAEHQFEVNAPCTLRLRASKYYLDETRSITASSGRIEIAAPQLARVQLRSRYEACTVILNDHAVGSPPVDLELAAGTYRTLIQCRDRTYTIRSLTIEPGQSFRRLDDFLQ